MANIDVGGGHGGRRSVNHEIPLIPFIDFLLCLVSFLLITAVWTQMARVNANAQVPGPPSSAPLIEDKARVLHLEMKESHFVLTWKAGSVVLNSLEVPRQTETLGDAVAYPSLADAVEAEWLKNEVRHFAASDWKVDQAVLHTDNSALFQDVVAVIDAIYHPQRDLNLGTATVKRPAFNVTFAVN